MFKDNLPSKCFLCYYVLLYIHFLFFALVVLDCILWGRQWVMFNVYTEEAHRNKWTKKGDVQYDKIGVDVFVVVVVVRSGLGGWIERGKVTCVIVYVHVAFVIRWPHTMAKLKVASPFKRESNARSQRELMSSSCFIKASISLLKDQLVISWLGKKKQPKKSRRIKMIFHEMAESTESKVSTCCLLFNRWSQEFQWVPLSSTKQLQSSQKSFCKQIETGSALFQHSDQ